MAHQSHLADWLLTQKDVIEFKATQYAWVDDFAPAYTDFGVVIDDSHVGRAIDQDPELALTKAIAESIERATCVHNGLAKSTGVAAHENTLLASQNAKLEVIERASFDFHFNHGIPFEKISPKSNAALFAVKKLASLGIVFDFYKMTTPSDVDAFCAVATGKYFERPFGGIFGFSCKHEAEVAEQVALFESLRNVACYTVDDATVSISIADFNQIAKPQWLDRFRLALDLDYWERIQFLFETQNQLTSQFPKFDFQFQHLPAPPKFESAPIVVMQATSNYQFGNRQDGLPSVLD